ncbi:MAG: ADP-ribosylglycohydrolase family protein [Methanospirillum sp.]|nr:ADP-ribosylglycohydrolase family protein [Methanospirillum sp.]
MENYRNILLSPGARMMLGIAAGDAYGRRFEDLPFTEIQRLIDQEPVRGAYTDDTQQALAVVELMVSGLPFTPVTLSESLLAVYRRDSRDGYSPVTRRMLEQSPDATTFLRAIPAEERLARKTDGAAMRALPIGFYPDLKEVITCSYQSAVITHGHPDAYTATVSIACIAHERYHHQTPFREIWRRIRGEIADLNQEIIPYCDACADLTTPDRKTILEGHAGYGVPYTESRILLGAVLALLAQFGGCPERLLREAVLMGGDTDTTAAIVLGAALIHGDIPEILAGLLEHMKDEPFGSLYLTMKGDRLSSRYPSLIA